MTAEKPDLVCYVYPGWAPRIRPASPKRDWMEDTPERFAYRCLPLAIANAHGWELLSPCAFEARWMGGSGTDAVEIRLDPGTDPRRAPVSLFGQGTITFHVEGIMRTAEGWNLMVGGPPNGAKDAIAPLSGMIETDWSPYTFTMNWRFTRENHWVRFEENEPFCFFFPVLRAAITEVAPRVLPMEQEPGLIDQFEAWSRSRDAFQKWVEETRPSAPADKWQKLYYRGVRPDGAPGAPDHQAKLRLPPFVQADGSPMRHPDAGSCPVTKPGPSARLQPAAGLASLLDSGALNIALGRIGFDAAPAARAGEPRQAAAVEASAAVPHGHDARGAWIAAARTRQLALAPGSGIRRVHRLSSEEFLRDHYAASQPVVIEGMIDDWPARTRWTPRYLKDRVGEAIVEYQADRDGSPDFELYKDDHKRSGPFGRFIDSIAADGNDAYLTAYNSGTNRDALAVLDGDIGTLDDYLTPGPGMMWIGPGGTFTPLHFDLTNNLIVQVVGCKELLVASPFDTPNLYNRRHVFSEVHDLGDPERLNAWPLARAVVPLAVTLNPGDMLYMPVGWWHQVRARSFSVTLTYTNFRWPNDAWESFPDNG